ncbi:putative tRNA N6-adenosine threonylcarbamoyltransferase isoform 2 [Schistosoma japonicum]|uniref:N(6)-L-threonylcarbamoyladenine synthase n=1 Tax=Schistosoma japonicum TaxID=6182 RepID=A0A4Z2DSE3_SCHJA|nr:putative tRNA N6-adenosine threonylcarbamoyltransferase, mitochondrial [Schistosoma japonicum]TNN19242.1 putative tRNA N6-adenosine threonylcarbamoyltransferase isoform 2 [Schistosoma japonicum]
MYILEIMRNKFRFALNFIHNYNRAKESTLLHRFCRCNFSNILGIETSCDDTAAAVIGPSGKLLGHCLSSQTKFSVMLGGVIPPVAAELHKENIQSVVDTAVAKSNIGFQDLNFIAVTVKPGMSLSLKIGVSFAKSLANRLKIPIIPIDHMEAHALTALFTDSQLEFPYMILLLSGGHGLLGIVQGLEDYILLGTALDASPGDVLDKLSRRLKLNRLADKSLKNVTGGKAIEIIAKMYGGNHHRFNLPLPRSQCRDCDFSFTGIHVAAEQLINKLESTNSGSSECTLSIKDIADICASVQFGMTRLICRRTQRALEYCMLDNESKLSIIRNRPTALVVSGGVGSNAVIRAGLIKVAEFYNLKFVAPPPDLCTDNGIMIAWNGFLLQREKSSRIITENISSVDFSPRY